MFLIELKNTNQKIAQAIAGEIKGAVCPKGITTLTLTDPDHLFPLIKYLNKINIQFTIQCKIPDKLRQNQY